MILILFITVFYASVEMAKTAKVAKMTINMVKINGQNGQKGKNYQNGHSLCEPNGKRCKKWSN